MANYQDSKALVLKFYQALEAASADHVGSVLDQYTSSDYRFRGVHPFNELDGADAVADTVWKPLLTAFTPLQRRQDIFMAGSVFVERPDSNRPFRWLPQGCPSRAGPPLAAKSG